MIKINFSPLKEAVQDIKLSYQTLDWIVNSSHTVEEFFYLMSSFCEFKELTQAYLEATK